MTHFLQAGWDNARLNSGTGISLSLTSTDLGATPLTMTTGTYAHVGMDGASGLGTAIYDDFATAFQAALNALENKYTVTFAPSTGLYTITRSAGVFTLTFAATATATSMRRILGFSATTGSAISHTSDVLPYYWIAPALPAVGGNSRPFHSEGVAFGGMSATGIPYGLAVDTPAKLETLTFMAESNTATFIDDLVAAVPFTWEAMFDHVMNEHPIGYHTGTNPGRIYMLLSDGGAQFSERNRERLLQPEWDAAWHVTLRGVRMGTFTV